MTHQLESRAFKVQRCAALMLALSNIQKSVLGCHRAGKSSPHRIDCNEITAWPSRRSFTCARGPGLFNSKLKTRRFSCAFSKGYIVNDNVHAKSRLCDMGETGGKFRPRYPADAAIVSHNLSTVERTSASSSPSAMTRISGSVPDLRISKRPLPSSAFSALAIDS